MRIRSLFLSALFLFPLCASAVTHEGNGWRIRKWAEETTTECGDVVVYHIEVTRTGPDAGEVDIVDGRGAGTTGYTFTDPAPDAGGSGGDNNAVWVREMNQGDTFTARYGVQFGDPLPVGLRVRNWVAAFPSNPILPHISVDYDIWVGAGNETTQAHPCTGEAGDPINTATGEFFLPDLVDLDLGGPLPLRFTRWYGSRLNDPGFDLAESALGVGWMHNYEVQTWKVTPLGHWEWSMQVLTEGGKRVDFTEVYDSFGSAGWSLNLEQETVPYEFKTDDHSDWFLDPERERLYRFRISGWSYVTEIMDRNGNSLLIQRRPDMLITNVTDGLGRSLDFDYTAEGNLSRVTDGTRTVGFAYDAQGTVIRVTNAMGHVVTYAYDPVHSHANLQGALMTGVQHPLGNIPYTQTYNADGQVIAQANAYGHTSTYTYVGGTTTVADPQGSFTHTHPNTRRATNLTNQAGNAFQIDYDFIRDLPTQVTDRHGHATLYQYELDSRRLTNVVHRDGGTTSYSYVWTEQTFTNREDTARTVQFSFRDLHTITHPDGTTETFHRDARGNVTSYVDRAGAEWITTFNSRGQPLTFTRPDGGGHTFTYNADGTLASETDSDTGVTTYTYDALRRRIRETRPDGGVTSMAYDAADRIIALTNAYGGAAYFQYDPNNLRAQETDPAGYVFSRHYDLMNRVTNRSDSIGPLAAVTYDPMSRPVIEVDPAGTNLYFYDDRGWLTNHTRAGRAWSWGYDPEGYLEEAVSPLGHRTAYQRDPMGRITNAVGPLLETQTLSYDRMGRVIRVTDANANTTRFVYDEAGRVAAITNALGASASFEYNSAGLVTRATDYNGHASSFAFTPMGRMAAGTNALGEATRYQYDASGRPVRIDFADGTHITRAHDQTGRLQSRTDGGTNTWSYGYNQRGDLVAVTNPAGGVTTYEYRLDGLLSAWGDTDIGRVTNVYDAARRLVETVLPDGARAQYEYNPHSQITAVTDANANRTEFAYDEDGRMIAETGADGHTMHVAYDASGRITNITDRAGQPTRFEYDAGGRRTATVDATGLRIEYGFNALDRVTSVTRGGETWNRAYDHSGRLTAHTTPLGRTTTFLLDAVGRPAGQVDPMGRTNRITRDPMGRITAIIDPAGRERTFAYDARGLLVSAGGTGQAPARYERNTLGNVTRVTDPNSNDWTFAHSLMGAMTGQTDPLGRSLAFTRNARGQIVEVTHPDAIQQSLYYDPVGNLTGTVYSAGLALDYAYDARNRLMAADGVALEYDPEGRITNTVSTADGRAFGAVYDAAGRLISVSYDGAFTVNYVYNPANGLLEAVSDTLSGATVSYTYDADGRVTGITRGNGQHVTYTYDPASRITRIQDGALIDVQYEYDEAGRLMAEEGAYPLDAADGLVSETPTFAYDAAAQVVSPGYAYDLRGRRTNAPGHEFAWDAASRLVEANGVALAYDGLDEVIMRTDGGIATRYYYNRALAPASIVSERNENTGQFVRHYVWTPGGRLLYAIDVASGNKPLYYHFDRNGSTLAITDENGDTTDAYAYTPFGRIVRRQGTSTQPFTFIGQYGIRQQDTVGVLYQMRARYYDAHTGRFLSPDPAWPNLEHPQKLNPYQYVGNQPLGRIDVDGFDWWGPDPDPLPRDADVSTMPDSQLSSIEGVLNDANRNDNINMPAARARLERVRAELQRRNPGRRDQPPDPVDPEHQECEQLPLNRASQPLADLAATPSRPQLPHRAGDIIAEAFGREFQRLMERKMAEELLREKERTMYAPQQPGGRQESPGRAGTGLPQRAGDIIAEAFGREFQRLMERKMAEELLREKEQTMYAPQQPRGGQEDLGRAAAEEPPAKRRFEIKEEWMRPPERPPHDGFPDPLADILNQLFGPEALMDFARQQQAEQQAQERAQSQASAPAPAPQQTRLSRNQLFEKRNDARQKVNDLMRAGDFEGARQALDDVRHWDNEINERKSQNPFFWLID